MTLDMWYIKFTDLEMCSSTGIELLYTLKQPAKKEKQPINQTNLTRKNFIRTMVMTYLSLSSLPVIK